MFSGEFSGKRAINNVVFSNQAYNEVTIYSEVARHLY